MLMLRKSMISIKEVREALVKQSRSRLPKKVYISASLTKNFKIAWEKENLTNSSQVLEELIEQVNRGYFNSSEGLKIQILSLDDRISRSFNISNTAWDTFRKNCKKAKFKLGCMLEHIMVEYITQVEKEHKIKIMPK